MATRWATISTVSTFALKVLAQRAIWFRFAPIRASSRVRSRSDLGVRHGPGAHPAHRPAHQIRQGQPCGARLGVPLGTLRLAGADLHPHVASGAPHGAVAVGGVRGGRAPRQPLPGTREAWPQRVGWLSRRSGQTRPPTVGTLGRQNRHTRILRSPPYAVSTTGKEAMSQGFQRRTRGGPGSASGRPRAAPGALSATHRGAGGDLGGGGGPGRGCRISCSISRW